MWHVVECPPLEITAVRRESGCHGQLHLLWRIDDTRRCFVGQSLPALVRFLNEQGGPVRFHVSSFYRVSHQCAKHHHGWGAACFTRQQLPELNKRLQTFECLTFLVRDPDRWTTRGPLPPDDPDPSA